MIELSIVVPIYNSEKTLKRCLDSVLSQSLKEIEVICVNDGSKDKSIEILKEYKKRDNRVIIIEQENKGLSKARNVGIQNATGKYITFIDSDDWIEPNTFIKVKQQIDANYEIIRIDYMINTKKRTESLEYKNKLYSNAEIKEDIIPKVLRGKIPSYSCLLYINMQTLKEKKWDFNEDTYYMEDMEYFLHICYECENIYFKKEQLYHYFVNYEGMTKSKKNYLKNMYGILQVHEKIIQILKENDDKYEERRKISDTIYANDIINYAYLDYRDNNNKEIFIILEKLLKTEQFKKIQENLQFKLLPFHLRIQLILVKENRIKLLKKLFFIRKQLTKLLKNLKAK